ncbi:MAG: hypothetical protein ACRC2M_12430 [Planktothrix sp.]
MTIHDQKNIIDDPLLEHEIKTVTKQSKHISSDKRIIKFTEDQEKIVQYLCQELSLSLQFLVNFAIRGALLYIKEQNKKLNDLQEYPKELGSRNQEFVMTIDTLNVLESSGMKDQFIECAIVGIELLYKTFHPLNNKAN